MKKNIGLVILIIVCLFVSGCGSKAPVSIESKSDLKSIISSNETATMPEAGVGVTKDIVKVPLENSGTFDIERDCQSYLSLGTSMETQEGYYLYEYGYLYYFDKEKKTFILTCGNPKCKHDSRACSAYYDTAGDIVYYEGYMYAIAGFFSEYASLGEPDRINLNLIKTSLDGSTTDYVTTIASVYMEDSESFQVNVDIIQHRGYLYYVYNVRAGNDKDVYSNGNNCLYRIKMDGSEKAEYIGPIERTNLDYSIDLKAFGNYVYVDRAEDSIKDEMFRYNIVTNEIELLKFGNYYNEGYIDIDGKIIYTKEINVSDIYIYNPYTNTNEVFIDLTDEQVKLAAFPSYDGTYIYILYGDQNNLDNWGYYVYTKEGKYVATIDLGKYSINLDNTMQRLTGNTDYMLFFTENKELYYIDKSEIASGSPTLYKAN